jgi:hypothetical protein
MFENIIPSENEKLLSKILNYAVLKIISSKGN